MKKTKIFFLALLCLFGKELYGQEVAGHHSPPTSGADAPDVDLNESRGAASVVIYGEIISKSFEDTLNLQIYENYMGNMVRLPSPQLYFFPVQGGDGYYGLPGQMGFSFTSEPIKTYAYGTVSSKSNGIIFNEFLMEPGDTIGVFLDRIKNTVAFTGPAAIKYRAQKDLNEALAGRISVQPARIQVNDISLYEEQRTGSKNHDYGIRSFVPYEEIDAPSIIESDLKEDIYSHPAFDILDQYKDRLDPEFYDILRVNLIGKLLFPKIFVFNARPKTDKNIWIKAYVEGSKELPELEMDPYSILYAPYYSDYLLEKFVADGFAHRSRPLESLIAIREGMLRDRMFAKFIARYYAAISNKEEYEEAAFSSMEDSTSLSILTTFLAGRKVGVEIPDFELTGIDKKPLNMHALKGKVVFTDFWFSGCGACVLYYSNTLSKVKEHFKDNKEVAFVTVSIDQKFSTWEKSVNSGKYTNSQAINLYTGGQGQYHPLIKFFSIRGYPSQILLDKSGRTVQTTGLNIPPDELIDIISNSINQSNEPDL